MQCYRLHSTAIKHERCFRVLGLGLGFNNSRIGVLVFGINLLLLKCAAKSAHESQEILHLFQ